MMVARPQHNKRFWALVAPFVLPVVSFIVGFGINYIDTRNELKNQSRKLDEVIVLLNKASDRQDKTEATVNVNSNRITRLETFCFGPNSQLIANNISPVK